MGIVRRVLIFSTFLLCGVWMVSLIQENEQSTIFNVHRQWYSSWKQTQEEEGGQDATIRRLARAYTPWQGERYGWCIPQQEESWDVVKGILFAKTFKTGSSTASAVTMQMAHRVALRKEKEIMKGSDCHSLNGHHMSTMNMVVNKTQPSILWTIVRHPTSRVISSYYFYLAGQAKQVPTTESIIHFADSVKNQQLIQLRTNRGPTLWGGHAIPKELQIMYNNTTTSSQVIVENIIANEILPIYDFIAVMERMDESLVVWKLLLDLNHGDIIVGSSKQSGGWDWDWDGPVYPNGTCFQIPKPNLTPEVQDYLHSTFVQDNGDFLLHDVANRNLDLTIDALGRQRVEKEVAQHRKLKTLIQEQCQDQVITPCDSQGNFQPQHRDNCFRFDEGCGYQCINKVLDEFERNGILDTL